LFLKAHNPKHFYQFGAFLLDPAERTLTRAGTPVPLTPKAFDTLLVLVRHSGHTVEKEELFKEVWPDTFVEDGNLAVKIFALRKALGHTDGGGEYIETIPKRGYRFNAKVEVRACATDGHPTIAAQTSVPALVGETRSSFVAGRIALLCLGAVALVGATAWLYRARTRPPLSTTDSVLVTDFVNTTGDPVFDDTVKQAVSVQLAQSPFLNILSDARVAATLRLMTKEVDAKLTPGLARDVCQRAGGKAYISGSIGNLGRQYILGLNVINC